ncbi:hypothetical protein C0580_03385 [Candidatus Parcubacteria bacterium]|nr:MAG: hypothetical protein C0580_03385 [Candidatus Parcubacteria bacterium]
MKKINLFKITLSTFVFLLVAMLGNAVQAEEYITDPSELPDQDAYKAIVKIKVFTSLDKENLVWYSSGSGVIIDSSGTILTNYHVVTFEDEFREGEYDTTYQVCLTDQIDEAPDCAYVAKLIAKDKDQDLALLKMEPISGLSTKSSGFKYLQLSDTDDSDVNDEVIVMGFPSIGGETITITKGIVSGKEEKYNNKWIKTDAVFSFGSSGGAAINSDGKVMGIPSQSHSDYAGSLGYLINSVSIKDWVDAYKSATPQTNVYIEDLKDFTIKQHEVEDTDTFSNEYFSITRPDDWEFTYNNEYGLYMDKPSDDEGGVIQIKMMKLPYDVSLDIVELYVKKSLTENMALSAISIIKNEDTTINGIPAKRMVLSGSGQTDTYYYITNKNYILEISYDYGVNEKDEDTVKDTIDSITLNNAPSFQANSSYTNSSPKFSLAASDGWKILEHVAKAEPIYLYNPKYSDSYISVSIQDTDENTRDYTNEEYLDYIKDLFNTANSAGSSIDAKFEISEDNAQYNLNNGLGKVIYLDSLYKKLSTDEVLARDIDYIVKAGDKFINVTFSIFTDDEEVFNESFASAEKVMKTFSLTNSPYSGDDADDDVDEDTTDTSDDQVSSDVEYTPPPATGTLSNRLRGRILLQVENHGEAWYVKPDSGRRIYMKDGDVAYDMMRNLGLGITNADLEKIPVGIEDRFECADTDGDGLCNKLEEGLGTDPNDSDSDDDGYDDGTEVKGNYNPLGSGTMQYSNTMINNLRGKILLQVESRGEAWYINPEDGKRYYMPDGPSAYQIMRYLSLGITNSDLAQISEE